MKRLSTTILVLGLLMPVYLVTFVPSTNAQTSVQCGDIFESELQNLDDRHTYVMNLSAGDTLSLTASPIGSGLALTVDVIDKIDTKILSRWGGGSHQGSVVVSATGEYTIIVKSWGQGVGTYTLGIGCTFRDGTTINPGDIAPEVDETSSTDISAQL